MGPDLGGVIISTSEQEIPMDSFKRKEGELLEKFEYQKRKENKSTKTC